MKTPLQFIIATLLCGQFSTLIFADQLLNAKKAISEKKYDEAIKELSILASDGQPEAYNLMGKMYQNGWGVISNLNIAKSYYEKAAAKGHLDSVNNIAALNTEKELKNITEKAQAGDPSAQNRLGEMYEYGLGVERSLKKAFSYYKQAADIEFTDAQINLGRCFQFGAGAKQNFANAEKWYLIAAQKGNKTSMFYLGTLYAGGHGLDKSYHQDIIAYAWMYNAAILGAETASAIENKLLMKLNKKKREIAIKLSKEYKEKYVTPFHQPEK